MSFNILALKIELTAGATILKLIFGYLDMSIYIDMCVKCELIYELTFHAHIAENDTSTFYFIKEINFIQ